MSSSRNNSTSSTSNSIPSSTPLQPHPSPAIRTRSVAWGTAVVLEREPSPLSDNDIVLATVRLSNPFQRGSKFGAEDLPSRPPARSFLRRLSTRMHFDHSTEMEERYKAVRMPRSEYKRYFKRDAEGKYAGTEAEKEWEEDEVMAKYAEYQSMPLMGPHR